MPKASEMTLDKNLSFLFKGPPGFGKTPAAATFAEEGPVWLAYFDKKKPVELHKFFHHIIKRPELLDNIEYDVYGAHNANEYLNKLIQQTKHCKYVAIITDSLTSLTAAAVNWSMGFRDPKGGKKDDINSNAPQLIPGWDEYKVETSLVVQALDVSLTLPCHIIWTAHPLPQLKTESVGGRTVISKSSTLVTYGNRVAGMVPGRFTEIYHFNKEIDYNTNPSSNRFVVSTDSIGDEFARSSLLLPTEIDITNKSFYNVWKELVNKT